MRTPNYLFGFDVFIVPVLHVPRLQLSPGVPVSEACRTEMDAWLLSRFGEQEVCSIRSGNVLFAEMERKIFVREDEARALFDRLS